METNKLILLILNLFVFKIKVLLLYVPTKNIFNINFGITVLLQKITLISENNSYELKELI